MKKILLTMFAVISVILSIQAYDEPIGLTTLQSFNKINVNANARVCLAQSDSFSIIVNGQDESVKNIKFKVEDGILKIESEEIVDEEKPYVRIFITTPDIEGTKINAGSNYMLKNIGSKH